MTGLLAMVAVAVVLAIAVGSIVFLTAYAVHREIASRRRDRRRPATVRTMTVHGADGRIAGVLKVPGDVDVPGDADQKMTDARIRLYEGRLRIGRPWPHPDMADRLLRFDASPEANDPYAADIRDAVINGLLDPPTTQREAAIVTGDNDWIAAELIAEEHRRGLPVGENRDHCSDCAKQAAWQEQKRLLERLIAECTHPETVELRTLSNVTAVELCSECGTELP